MAMTPADSGTSLPLKEETSDAAKRFHKGDGVIISEPLAYHQQLIPGDSILLHTKKGLRQFPILGIFYDYTSSRGMIAMHHNLYRRWWDDENISGLTVYRSPDMPQDRLLNNVRALIADADSEFVISSNQEIRQVVMSVFDRTFIITDVLRFLAVLVAFVGVLSALIALQLERIREFGVLRAIGMTPWQIRGMIIGQTGLIGLIAGMMAIPLGLIMAEVLIEVINRRAFGWSMQQLLPANVLLQALMLAISAALLASVYPAFRASSILPAQALREE
jgi:putative ABC transport system permease protein